MKKIIYITDNKQSSRGIWTYANEFEKVFQHLRIDVIRLNLDSGNPSSVIDLWRSLAKPLIHIEFSSTSVNAFKLFFSLMKVDEMEITGTIHDAPYLVWGPSAVLSHSFVKIKLLRKVMDVLFYNRLEKKLTGKLKAIITLTYKGKKELKKRLGSKCPPIKVVRHISYSDMSENLRNNPKSEFSTPIKLLFFGEMRKGKGLDELLSAIKTLNRNSLELHMVGDGPLRKWFLTTYEAYPNAPKLIYYGALDDDKIHRIFHSVDAAILPYNRKITYGASGALMRVMCSGLCPIIPSDEECLSEYVIPGYTGLQYNRQNLNEFLLNLNDKETIKQIGRQAKEWCIKNTISKALANELGDFFSY